jgi:hypothetical protein
MIQCDVKKWKHIHSNNENVWESKGAIPKTSQCISTFGNQAHKIMKFII